MLKLCWCGTDDGTVIHISYRRIVRFARPHHYGGHEEELTFENIDPSKVCNRTLLEEIHLIITFYSRPVFVVKDKPYIDYHCLALSSS